jgi:hypothetical protein
MSLTRYHRSGGTMAPDPEGKWLHIDDPALTKLLEPYVGREAGPPRQVAERRRVRRALPARAIPWVGPAVSRLHVWWCVTCAMPLWRCRHG